LSVEHTLPRLQTTPLTVEQHTSSSLVDDTDLQDFQLVNWEEERHEEETIGSKKSRQYEDLSIISDWEEAAIVTRLYSPVFILTDADPHGLQIALTYKIESKVFAHF
jgi:hypothetical protein